MKTVWLILPGIRAKPGEMFAWTDRAARHIAIAHDTHAEKLEYKAGAIRSPWKLNRLADNLACVVRAYNDAGFKPNILAHSNGNVLVSRMLRKAVGLRIGEWHAAFPAMDSGCDCNGINGAVADGMLGTVVCYGSASDDVVAWGFFLTGWLKAAGLGYGDASTNGLVEIADKSKVRNIRIDRWGHSDFAAPGVLVPFLLEYVLRG